MVRYLRGRGVLKVCGLPGAAPRMARAVSLSRAAAVVALLTTAALAGNGSAGAASRPGTSGSARASYPAAAGTVFPGGLGSVSATSSTDVWAAGTSASPRAVIRAR